MSRGRSIQKWSSMSRGRSMARESSMPHNYPPECFVVSVYQGSWYVDEVKAKESEAGVEERDEYLLVSFMTKFDDNSFKWPRRLKCF
jgi:hypothetical protein